MILKSINISKLQEKWLKEKSKKLDIKLDLEEYIIFI